MKKRLPELDSLRGFAALIVVFYHLTMRRVDGGYKFEYGHTAVDLFFIISGFVIFLSINNTKSWKQYVLNRLIRLYPTYWFCVSITACLMLVASLVTGQPTATLLKSYLINLTMFQYYFDVWDLDGPYWTLKIEMLFYIGILLLFLAKKTSSAELVGYIFLGLIMLNKFVLNQISPFIHNSLTHALPIMKYFPMFLAGILFYKMKFDKETNLRYLGLAYCFACTILLSNSFTNNSAFLVEYFLITAFYYSIWFLYLKNKLNFIVSKPTLFLGRISYSLYLIHQYLSIYLIIPLLTNRLQFNFWIAAFIALTISIFAASMITIYFEEPMIKRLKGNLLIRKSLQEKELISG